jgi:lipopolysaccharide export system protein LptA
MRLRPSLPVLLLGLPLAGAALGPPVAHALSSDREQPIHIAADRLEIDDVKHVSVYRGNVHYSQGTMQLEADTVTIYYDAERKFQRLQAQGQPARFRQRPDGQAEDMRGEAARIEYVAAPEALTLKQQAHVWNQGDEFSGDVITYDITGNHVVARRSGTEGGRVQVIIQPRAQTPAPAPAPAPAAPASVPAPASAGGAAPDHP